MKQAMETGGEEAKVDMIDKIFEEERCYPQLAGGISQLGFWTVE